MASNTLTTSEESTDPLQAALDEAEHLMEELGTTNDSNNTVDTTNNNNNDLSRTASIDDDVMAFSLGQDEEFVIDGEDVPLHDDLPDAAATKEAGDPLSQIMMNDTRPQLHPLQDDYLGLNATATTSPLSTPPPLTQPPQSTSTPAFPTASAPGKPGFAMTGGGTGGSMFMASSPYVAASPQPATNAFTDVFKVQTSRFASNLANMAQRAATQVAQATGATSPAEAVMPPSGVGLSPGLPTMGIKSTSSGGLTTSSNVASASVVNLDQEQRDDLIRQYVGELLPGERVIMFLSNLLHVSDSTGFVYSYSAQPGTTWCCVMTYYRLMLFGTAMANPEKPEHWNAACWPPLDHQCPALIQIPLTSLEKVERSIFTASTGLSSNPISLMGLLLYGKDNARQVRFTTANYADTLRAHEALQTYAFPGRRNLGYLFAFESKRQAVMASVVTDPSTGQKSVTLEPVRQRFRAVAEYQRQLAKGGPNRQQPWAIWTAVNQSYQTCPSYPSVLVGPASLDENQMDAQKIIRLCAAFRSEYRLPSLTWSSGIDGASLWRCSQPKIGLQGNRSQADEIFLKHILESALAANAMATTRTTAVPRSILTMLTGTTEVQNWLPEPQCGLKILDLRPRSAAMANRTGGYGYENVGNYPGTTLQFCNIGNIHAVQNAYQKLSALCQSPSNSDLQWHASVEETKWLSHIRLILAAAWEAVFWIQVHRLPVLLHCSHGWDRTSQVAVLAQLLLDPYYRTREGFACLVEKDFMSFGHPFHTRCAHGESRNGDSGTVVPSTGGSADEGQISPIFIQFLDCVYQIVHQYPECFEFNTKYLLIMSEHLYSCRFGNFLCDTERERELVAAIRQRTHSIWDYLDSRTDTINTSYSAEQSMGVMLMPLATLLRNVSLWTDRHCRHSPKPTLRWLPLGATRTPTEWDRDQDGPLMTEQENQLLISQAAWGLRSSIHSTRSDVDETPDKSE